MFSRWRMPSVSGMLRKPVKFRRCGITGIREPSAATSQTDLLKIRQPPLGRGYSGYGWLGRDRLFLGGGFSARGRAATAADYFPVPAPLWETVPGSIAAILQAPKLFGSGNASSDSGQGNVENADAGQ